MKTAPKPGEFSTPVLPAHPAVGPSSSSPARPPARRAANPAPAVRLATEAHEQAHRVQRPLRSTRGRALRRRSVQRTPGGARRAGERRHGRLGGEGRGRAVSTRGGEGRMFWFAPSQTRIPLGMFAPCAARSSARPVRGSTAPAARPRPFVPPCRRASQQLWSASRVPQQLRKTSRASQQLWRDRRAAAQRGRRRMPSYRLPRRQSRGACWIRRRCPPPSGRQNPWAETLRRVLGQVNSRMSCARMPSPSCV